MTVREICEFINSLAPFEAKASFDNVGLLVGCPDWEVRGIHVAMDVTDAVLDEAEQLGANLIVTHHPMMLDGRKTMTEDDPEGWLLCRMIRSRTALIAAHTNLDQAPGGINDVLAQVCGLTNITGEGYVRAGDLPAGTTAGSIAAAMAQALHTDVRVMGQLPTDQPLRRMMVSSGAGSGSWEHALEYGADVFLSGEIKHHHALALTAHGVLCLEAGHFATEEPGIFALADALQTHLNAVQYKGFVSKSRVGCYAMKN